MDEMNDMAFVDSQLGDTAAGEAAPVTNDVDPAATVVDPAGAGTADVVTDPGSGGDNEPAGEPPAEDQSAQGDAPKEGEGEGEPPLDELLEDLSVGALNKKLEANPTLKAELEKDPATRNLVFSALRRSAKLDQFEQIFTNPETAKFTLDTANEMIEFDRLFRSEDTQDAQGFLQALQYNSWSKDEQGNILTDANGQPVSTGAYERIMGTYRNAVWDFIEQKAKDTSDDELGEAVRIIKEKIEGVSSGKTAAAPVKEGEPELPASVKARLQRLDELERRDKESQTTSQQEFIKGVNTDINAKLTDEVKKLVEGIAKRSNVVLSDYERKNIVRDSIDTIRKNLNGNPAYKNMITTLIASGVKTADGRQKIVNYAVASAKQSLPRVVAGHVSTATKSVVSTAQARKAKIDTQVNRREVQTTGSASTKSQASPDAKSIVAAAAKAKGKPLTELEEVNALLEAGFGG